MSALGAASCSRARGARAVAHTVLAHTFSSCQAVDKVDQLATLLYVCSSVWWRCMTGCAVRHILVRNDLGFQKDHHWCQPREVARQECSTLRVQMLSTAACWQVDRRRRSPESFCAASAFASCIGSGKICMPCFLRRHKQGLLVVRRCRSGVQSEPHTFLADPDTFAAWLLRVWHTPSALFG